VESDEGDSSDPDLALGGRACAVAAFAWLKTEGGQSLVSQLVLAGLSGCAICATIAGIAFHLDRPVVG